MNQTEAIDSQAEDYKLSTFGKKPKFTPFILLCIIFYFILFYM